MGVLRPPCTLALRRLGILLAAAGIVVLASIAAAKTADGGHSQTSLWDRMGGRAAGIAPLRWLRASSHSFQTLMRMLAERSVRVHGATRPGPVYPRDEHETEERDEHEGDEPPHMPFPNDRPPRPPAPLGGEARAGPHRTTAKSTSGSRTCRGDAEWPVCP